MASRVKECQNASKAEKRVIWCRIVAIYGKDRKRICVKTIFNGGGRGGGTAFEGRGGILGDYSFSPPPSPRGRNPLAHPSPTLLEPNEEYAALSGGEGKERLEQVGEEGGDRGEVR